MNNKKGYKMIELAIILLAVGVVGYGVKGMLDDDDEEHYIERYDDRVVGFVGGKIALVDRGCKDGN